MKFLIAGFGSIGRRHFRNLKALGHSDIILYRTGKSTLPVDEIENVPVYYSLDEALDHKPDAVIVANPTANHLEVALKAAQCGCHLFLEKPISHKLDGISELVKSVSENQIHVLVGYQFRYHPGILMIKQLLGDGTAGRPLSFRAEWGEYLPAWHPWEDYRKSYTSLRALGGGVVLTLSHPIDYLHWLFGEISDLWAFSGKVSDLEIEVEDYAEAGLRFGSGVVGSLHLDYFQRPAVHKLEISTTVGKILWDNADGSTRFYSAEADQWQSYDLPAGFERNDLFLAQTRHFVDVIQGKALPICSLEDGIDALKVALAIYRASSSKSLVKIGSIGA